MSVAGVEVEGGERFADSLRAASQQLATLDTADAHASDVLADRIRAEEPTDTGLMRRRTTATVRQGHHAAVVDTPYAGIVNARNPFVSRGLSAALGDVVDVYADHAATALRSVQGA